MNNTNQGGGNPPTQQQTQTAVIGTGGTWLHVTRRNGTIELKVAPGNYAILADNRIGDLVGILTAMLKGQSS